MVRRNMALRRLLSTSENRLSGCFQGRERPPQSPEIRRRTQYRPNARRDHLQVHRSAAESMMCRCQSSVTADRDTKFVVRVHRRNSNSNLSRRANVSRETSKISQNARRPCFARVKRIASICSAEAWRVSASKLPGSCPRFGPLGPASPGARATILPAVRWTIP